MEDKVGWNKGGMAMLKARGGLFDVTPRAFDVTPRVATEKTGKRGD